MQLPFAGSVLSWSHRDRVLVVDVHAPPGAPAKAEGPLVEWEALARYLRAGADDASGLLVVGADGLDAGLCWSSLSGRVDASWSALPGFVARIATSSELTAIAERVSAVWRAIRRFEPPSVLVVGGACARGGVELAGTVDRVVAERRPGLDAQLRAAGIEVDQWVGPGQGRRAGLGALGAAQVLVATHEARQSVYSSTRSEGAAWSRMSQRSSS